MTASLIALEQPDAYPVAAAARLVETSTALTAAAWHSPYAAWLTVLARVAARAAPLIASLVAGTATEAELAALANAERLGAAGSAWANELARRSAGRARSQAMNMGRLCRRLWADVRLPRREFAPTAYLGMAWERSLALTPIRILAGAETTLADLAGDPLVSGPSWDVAAQADLLAAWVRIA